MIGEFQKQYELDYVAKTVVVLKQVTDRRKSMNEKKTRMTLELTTFGRNERTMEATILKKTTTTRPRIMGRVERLRTYSENGDRSATSTSQQMQ